MPGPRDPTNYQLPQKPMNRCMFPKASRNRNLRGVTNPYEADIDGIRYVQLEAVPRPLTLSVCACACMCVMLKFKFTPIHKNTCDSINSINHLKLHPKSTWKSLRITPKPHSKLSPKKIAWKAPESHLKFTQEHLHLNYLKFTQNHLLKSPEIDWNWLVIFFMSSEISLG